MQKKLIYTNAVIRLLAFAVLITFCGCSKNVYIFQQHQFGGDANYTGEEQICSSYPTKQSEIYKAAELYCANKGKKAHILSKNYYTSCSATHPVVTNFRCE